MNVFELSAKLGLDTSEYDKGLDDSAEKGSNWASNVGSALGKAGKGIGIAMATVGTASTALGTAFYKSAKQVSENGDLIDKQSQKLGVSATAYQKWDYVMNLAGTSMQNMGSGLKTLTNKLDDAKNGSEDAQAMFEKLGISLEDINTMSREELFENAIYGFQAMADSTERASLANDLFGKSGQELTPLFNQTAESTKELMQNLEDMGAVMSDDAVKASADFQDSLTTLSTALSGLKNGAMAEFLPALTDIMNGLTKIFTGDGSGIQSIRKGVDNIAKGITNALPKIVKAGMEIVKSLSKAILDNIPTLLETAMDVVEEFANMILDNLPMIADTALEIIFTLGQGLADALPTLIPKMVEVMLAIVDTLINNIDKIIETAIIIMKALIEGIMNAIPLLIEKAPEIIVGLINGIISGLGMLLDFSEDGVGRKVLSSLWEGIKGSFHYLITNAPEILGAIVDGVVGALGAIWDLGVALVQELWEGMKSLWNDVRDWWNGCIDSLRDAWDVFIEEATTDYADFAKGDIVINPSQLRAYYDEQKRSAPDVETISWDEFIAHFEKDANGNYVLKKEGNESFAGYLQKWLNKYGQEPLKEAPKSKNYGDEIDPNSPNAGWKPPERIGYNDTVSIPSESLNSYGGQPIIVESIIKLDPDSAEIFRIVEQENRINTRATGYNALAME